jgi:hypothetical protein
MLVQPLLQLMVPVAQHLLDSTAANAAVLPAADAMVQQRVAVVSFLSHLLLSLLDVGMDQLVCCKEDAACLAVHAAYYSIETNRVVQHH